MQIRLNSLIGNIADINKNYANKFMPVKNNLSPLDKDTVSFGQGGKKLSSIDMKFASQEKDYRDVSVRAIPPLNYLEQILKYFLSDLTIDKSSDEAYKNTSKNPIEYITKRTKKPSSIREKVVSTYSQMVKDEYKSFLVDTFNAFTQSFKIKEGVQNTKIKSVISRTTRTLRNNSDIPLYANADIYIPAIFDNIKEYFSFDNMNESEQNALLANIINDFKTGESKKEFRKHVQDGKYIDPSSVEGILHYAKDIVGSRIILDKSSPGQTMKVLKRIQDAATTTLGKSKEPLFTITSIEVFLPDKKKIPNKHNLSEYMYAPYGQLEAMARATGAKYIEKDSKSGYLAIHINVDLSNSMLNTPSGDFRGYGGEIQIIDSNVEKLKEIEDKCYKLKDNKANLGPFFDKFKEHFRRYYNERNAQAFNDYTYALYMHQKSIPPGYSQNNFPGIAELGFSGLVPEQLDFNTLKMIYDDCERAQANHDVMQKGINIPKNDENLMKSISNKITWSLLKRLKDSN